MKKFFRELASLPKVNSSDIANGRGAHQHSDMSSTKALGLPLGMLGRQPVITLQIICMHTQTDSKHSS